MTTLPTTPQHLQNTPQAEFRTQPWVDQKLSAGSYRVERVSWQSQGTEVVGNLFLPEQIGAYPAVVIIGPVAYVKEQSPLQYASRLVREGFATLIFDPRFHGESSGEPRRF
ncbi:MAG TPA: alpha/beta hydrolase, partial [Thiolinea sp.]|nr:alpha/beta hydrolase [Thiolinea sp.]